MTMNRNVAQPILNTSTVFISTNPVLLDGQAAHETDTNRSKLGDGTSTYTQLTYNEFGYEIVEAAGTDTYTGTFASDLFLAYFPMMRIRVRFTNTNTGVSTINLNGLGAKSLVKTVATALSAGDILAGGIYDFAYDGTNFQMLSPSGTTIAGSGTVTSVSVVTNQGVSGSVANPTTTPAITLTLGALTGVTSLNGLVVTANTGVVTTGTWNATLIGTQYGGTGANNSGATVGAVPYYSSSTVQTFLAATATAGQMLRSAASAAPTWSTNVWPNTTPVNQILHATAANVIGGNASFLYDGTQMSVGTTITANRIINAQGSVNTAVGVDIKNNTSGTVAFANLVLRTTTQSAQFYLTSTGYSTVGGFVANQGGFIADCANGMAIMATNAAGFINFFTAGSAAANERMRITAASNVKIAGTAVRATTEGTNHLDIFDGTAPVGTLANGISLYSTAGELRVMDAGGTATLLSPHSKEKNEIGVRYWVYDSVDTVTNTHLVIDMEKMMKAINKKFGWDFVKQFSIK